MRWKATDIFNHFVVNHVFTDYFLLPNQKTLKALTGMPFNVNSECKSSCELHRNEVNDSGQYLWVHVLIKNAWVVSSLTEPIRW